MQPNSKSLYKLLVALPANCLSIAAFGQQTAAGNQPQSNNTDYTMITLVGLIAVVLAFVIYGMGQVLTMLGKQVIEKSKQQNKIIAVFWLIGFCLVPVLTKAQDQTAATVATTSNQYGGLNNAGFWILVTVVFTEFVTIAWLMSLIKRLQAELSPQKAKASSFAIKKWWTNIDRRLFTKAVPVEREENILLNHDYDGIQELDNSLPPWWKWGFGITIIISIIYMLNFHVLGYGKNPEEEYTAEMEIAKEQKEIYEAKNADKVDENDVKMPDASGLAAGKELFTTACFACHGKLGEGGAGPNLTDDYWLHKGSISDIYKSIKYGYPEKGMQSWEKNFSPRQISNLAGYIKSLRGTNPANAKAPQGDLFAQEVPDHTPDSQPVNNKEQASNITPAKT